MILDYRITDDDFICMPYSKTATQYIGGKGYFADNISDFSNLDTCCFGMLAGVETKLDHPYYCAVSDGGAIIKGNFSFFLPEIAVMKEKKFRPYTFEELPIKVCDTIYLKNKNTGSIETCLCISILDEDNQIKSIAFGVNSYTIQELFENYVWRASYFSDFILFGVEEN